MGYKYIGTVSSLSTLWLEKHRLVGMVNDAKDFTENAN